MGIDDGAGGLLRHELAGRLLVSIGTGWDGGDIEYLVVAARYWVVCLNRFLWLPGDLEWVFHGSLSEV